MAKTGLEVALDGLTDAQLLELIKAAGGEKKEETAPPVKFQLSDGSEIVGKDNEDVNRLLVARLEEAQKAQRQVVEPQQQQHQNPQQPKWDYKTFSEKFVTDPREGMEYFEMANYGMPVGKTMPALMAITAALAKKVQDLETGAFASASPEYADPAVRSEVDKILTSRGWQPSRQSYEDALAIARSTGKVKAQEEKKQDQPKLFIPPRTTRSNSDSGQPTDEDLMRAANDMELSKLEDILSQAGMLKARRF